MADLPVVSAPPDAPMKVDAAVSDRKRGRPEKWTPALTRPVDRVKMASLKEQYGPLEQTHESFLTRYRVFCTMNHLEQGETESLLLCIAQALNAGMAMSSLNTSISYVLHRVKMKEVWMIKALLNAGHADAPLVQPRKAVIPGDLPLMIDRVCKEDIADGSLLWLMFATGCRAGDARVLRSSQIAFTASSVKVSWWLRKAQRVRSQRHEAEYLFAWSSVPCGSIMTYLGGQGEEAIVPRLVKYSRPRISATVTQLLRTHDCDFTSYVFRDRLDGILCDLKMAPDAIKLLMDHSVSTSHSSYLKGEEVKKASITHEAKKEQEAKRREGIKKSQRLAMKEVKKTRAK